MLDDIWWPRGALQPGQDVCFLGGGNPAQRCGHCGSTTHLRKDCPVRKAEQKAEQDKKKAEKEAAAKEE